ncbi:MAG TPA: hypothetical protein VMT46_12610 [Anaerolineaceae bacterium]|nr:hypothetical protein [Anaerolineaceae bacterium]
MAVKVLMTWDISPEHEQEYFEFVVREFIPGLQRMGFEVSDAWATVFGSQPQIMVGAVSSSTPKVRQILRSTEWKSLNNQLQDFVRNYSQKVVEARSGFQF